MRDSRWPALFAGPPGLVHADDPTAGLLRLVVPADWGGRLIGRKGARIHETQVQSGARIQLSDIGEEKLVEISGPRASVEEAVALMIDDVAKAMAPTASSVAESDGPAVIEPISVAALVPPGLAAWLEGDGGDAPPLDGPGLSTSLGGIYELQATDRRLLIRGVPVLVIRALRQLSLRLRRHARWTSAGSGSYDLPWDLCDQRQDGDPNSDFYSTNNVWLALPSDGKEVAGCFTIEHAEIFRQIQDDTGAAIRIHSTAKDGRPPCVEIAGNFNTKLLALVEVASLLMLLSAKSAGTQLGTKSGVPGTVDGGDGATATTDGDAAVISAGASSLKLLLFDAGPGAVSASVVRSLATAVSANASISRLGGRGGSGGGDSGAGTGGATPVSVAKGGDAIALLGVTLGGTRVACCAAAASILRESERRAAAHEVLHGPPTLLIDYLMRWFGQDAARLALGSVVGRSRGAVSATGSNTAGNNASGFRGSAASMSRWLPSTEALSAASGDPLADDFAAEVAAAEADAVAAAAKRPAHLGAINSLFSTTAASRPPNRPKVRAAWSNPADTADGVPPNAGAMNSSPQIAVAETATAAAGPASVNDSVAGEPSDGSIGGSAKKRKTAFGSGGPKRPPKRLKLSNPFGGEPCTILGDASAAAAAAAAASRAAVAIDEADVIGADVGAVVSGFGEVMVAAVRAESLLDSAAVVEPLPEANHHVVARGFDEDMAVEVTDQIAADADVDRFFPPEDLRPSAAALAEAYAASTMAVTAATDAATDACIARSAPTTVPSLLVPKVVTSMALELGIDPAKEAGLLWIAEDALDLSRLPDGWTVHLDAGSGRKYFSRQSEGVSVWEHPLGDFYRGAVFMARGGGDEVETSARDQPPTADEVASMAEYFGIGPDEPGEVLAVARMAVSAPLPPDWEEVEDENDTVFRRQSDGHQQTAHPLDAYFVELIRRRRLKAKEVDPLLEKRKALLRKLAEM